MQTAWRLLCDRKYFLISIARGVGGGRFWNAKGQYPDGGREVRRSATVSTARIS